MFALTLFYSSALAGVLIVLYGARRSIYPDQAEQPVAPSSLTITSFHSGAYLASRSGLMIKLFASLLGLSLFLTWVSIDRSGGQSLIISGTLGGILSTLIVTDWADFRLPNLGTATLLIVGAAIALSQGYEHFVGMTLGSISATLLFLVLAYLGRLVSRRPSLGMGDIKLIAGLGYWISPSDLPTVTLIASFFGILHIIVMASMTHGEEFASAKAPFGSYLCIGALLVW